MLAFFLTPLGKITGILLAVSFVALTLWGMLKIHDAGIRREALANFNAKQMEIVIKQQKEFIEQTKRIEQLQQKTIQEIVKQNEELQKKLSDVEEYLASPEVQKNESGVSEILKETIRRLGNQK